MSRSTVGAIIDQGPQSWQIIQQEAGFGQISLSGRWATEETISDARVYARIVREETGESVIHWQAAQQLPEKRWEIDLKHIPAGGLYRVETCLAHADVGPAIEWSIRGDMIHHIGIGDLFVIAGQSNSAGYGKDSAYDPPELGVHVLRNNGSWDLAAHPLNDSTNTLHPVNMENGNPGHSPYVHFGKLLKKELGYPIGFLQTALGGSKLCLWNPDEDGALYRNMMEIISSQQTKVKGILWYQGCSDAVADLCETYLERFQNMVNCIRRDLASPDLPVLTVQLNRQLQTDATVSDHTWGSVREAQRQAARTISNVYVVPALDCGMSDWIHNRCSANLMLGERLARAALAAVYHRQVRYMAPDLKSAVRTGGNQVLLEFDNVYDRLDTMGVPASQLPFTIEDESGVIPITDCRLMKNNQLLLTLERQLNGKGQVHGAHQENPPFFLPVDFATHMPILAFYKVDIQ
ncbi:MAG: sialate O-acetylesterase [Caldicoprobacterales bacterium]|jgi:sialate O-acetylesterase|nr:sialate O-acetylesterase [Clostridiales bacterium]